MNNFKVKRLSCMRHSTRAELKYNHGILLLIRYYSHGINSHFIYI